MTIIVIIILPYLRPDVTVMVDWALKIDYLSILPYLVGLVETWKEMV